MNKSGIGEQKAKQGKDQSRSAKHDGIAPEQPHAETAPRCGNQQQEQIFWQRQQVGA